MKSEKLIILLLGFAVFAGCVGKAPSITTAGATFEVSPEVLEARRDTLVDIGSLHAGEIVQYDAWILNAGSEPMVITGIDTSCGCTSVEYERGVIVPNEKGAFSFRFDSRGMWGMQMKLIEIKTSAASTPYKIIVRAEIQNN